MKSNETTFTNPAAFPVIDQNSSYWQEGMTLLDYFAGKSDVSSVEFGSIKILQEFIGREIRDNIFEHIQAQFEAKAKLKYMEAKAMLIEREKHLR